MPEYNVHFWHTDLSGDENALAMTNTLNRYMKDGEKLVQVLGSQPKEGMYLVFEKV